MSLQDSATPGQQSGSNLAYRTTCDVGVICAKSEELRAVHAIFSRTPFFKQIRGDTRSELIYAVDDKLTIKLTTCSEMGHMSAAVRVAQVLSVSRPEIVVFVGTAASLKPREVQLGDVVIPKKAVIRRYEKVSERGQNDYDDRKIDVGFKEFFFDETALISDLSSIGLSVDALDLVAALDFDSLVLENQAGEKVTIGEQVHTTRDSKIHDDVDIFSCGMVVDSIAYRNFIVTNANSNLRKSAIIDMESHGFFTAIENIPTSFGGSPRRCSGIMIRGVSDYAGRKSQTEERPISWKSLAVRNAARVTAELISVISKRT